MNRIAKRFGCLCLAVAMTVPAVALAQDVAAPTPPAAQPTPAAEPAPAGVEATSAPVAETTAYTPLDAPAATEETEPAPAEDASAPVAGWFRVDSDIGGLQLWGGATFPVSDTIGIATDIYVVNTALSGVDASDPAAPKPVNTTIGEFDIGPSITLAPGISILPMVGLAINWNNQKAAYFVPQFYAYVDTTSIYFELWSQFFLGDMFNEGTMDYVHLRAFPLYKINDLFALGIEVDANVALKNAPTDAAGDDISPLWLPLGPHLKMNAGAASTIELFVGYDLAPEEANGDRRLAGRFTFVQTF
jgi:hypothetical protein